MTLAPAAIRTACFCLEARAETKPSAPCPDAFTVLWQDSLCPAQAAHSTGRERRKRAGPRSHQLLVQRRPHGSGDGEMLKTK